MAVSKLLDRQKMCKIYEPKNVGREVNKSYNNEKSIELSSENFL